MSYFLRFPVVSAEADLACGTSLDFLAVTFEEAGLEDGATEDSRGQRIVEAMDGVCAVLPGLCGHELQSETVEDAIKEAQGMTALSYGDITTQDWAIYEGEYLAQLPFGDGVAFRAVAVVHSVTR